MKSGANGQDGVNGQYLAAMVSQHTGKRKNGVIRERGFVMSPFFGYNMPLIVDGPFHTKEYPGNSAAYVALLTAGVKLGWAF